MKAMVIRDFGGPEVFEPADLPVPQIIPRHVLVKVLATSVNPVDSRIRSGQAMGMAPDLPAVLHGDLAGIVEQVGEGVDTFQPGDEVFGLGGGTKGTVGGALGDYMLVDADFLAVKPQKLNMVQSAALPLVSLAAWQALIERGGLTKGQSVLVHAVAGGVGHIAIQIAKWAGAKVYATAATPEKIALGEELGATCINYEKENVRDYVAKYTDKKGFDLVFDTVGGENLEKSFAAVKTLGQVVSIATRSTHDLSLMNFKGLTLHVVYTMYPLVSGLGRKHYGQIMTQISRLADEGYIKPVLDPNIFTFVQAGAAHKHLESGKAFGKVTLVNE